MITTPNLYFSTTIPCKVPLHTHNVVLFLVSSWKQTFGVRRIVSWQIGLERILILPLAPCGFDTPYLSLPPLGIATMIPYTWGLSVADDDKCGGR